MYFKFDNYKVINNFQCLFKIPFNKQRYRINTNLKRYKLAFTVIKQQQKQTESANL